MCESHLLDIGCVPAHKVGELRREYGGTLAHIEQVPEEVGVVDAPEGLAAAGFVGALLARYWLVAGQHAYCAHYHLALRQADISDYRHRNIMEGPQGLEIFGHE